MNLWVKRKLRLWFGLVEHERVDEVYSRWFKSMQSWEEDRKKIGNAIADISTTSLMATREIGKLRDIQRDLALKLAMVDVAPKESMSRAYDLMLDFRTALLAESKIDCTSLDKAMDEINRGLETYQYANRNGDSAHANA